MRKRRIHSSEFKARVAIKSIIGIKPTEEIADDDAIHPIQVSQWKRELLGCTSELFTRGKKTTDTDELQAKEAELFQYCFRRSPFHGRITQGVPLLQQVDPQHGGQRVRRAPTPLPVLG
jgi:transposase